MEKIGAIIQVRMSSQRLPGKVLHSVGGKPLLQYILENLEHTKSLHNYIVATSIEKSDDPIEDFCHHYNAPCFRGSLTDVASRFKEISECERWDAFVRINGDSPLIDPQLIDYGVNLFRKGDFDLVTNVFPRTYPTGQSIEVVNTDTYNAIYPKMSRKEDFEHVTHFFYRNSNKFRIQNIRSENDYSQIHLAVDTPQDMQFFATLVLKLPKPLWKNNVDAIVKNIQELYPQ